MKFYFEINYCPVDISDIEDLLDKYKIDYKIKEVDENKYKLKLYKKSDKDFVINLFKQLGINLDFKC